MTLWTLIRRGLHFHWRAHIGVLLGAVMGSAALIGALVVGDSVRQTLTDHALSRLGPIHFALYTPERLFATGLGDRLAIAPSPGWVGLGPARTNYAYLNSAKPYFMALSLPGTVSTPAGSSRANRVNVIGVEMPAWPQMAGWAPMPNPQPEESAYLNQRLARHLGVKPGDEIVVRVRKPSALTPDATISPREEQSVGMRLRVAAILTPRMLGDFSLSVGQEPPANLFVSLALLQSKIGAHDSANLITASSAKAISLRWFEPASARRRDLATRLSKKAPAGVLRQAAGLLNPAFEEPVSDTEAAPSLTAQIGRAWQPEDLGISVRTVEPPQNSAVTRRVPSFVEIKSSRIFLEPAIWEAAIRPRTEMLTNRFAGDSARDIAAGGYVTNGFGLLTYLANLISVRDRAVPIRW
jgi:hypothetical protein